MKKFLLISLIALSVSSCTYEDVVNYLNGNENNLTEQQKAEVEAQSLTTSQTDLEQLELDRDKNGGRP